ncbi:hypothetical protein FQA47_013945 [Oryzias melastigma]|uniref:Uncharacterized protein n=1 Tax=Oryzias melastigma TaxID=30732 RepID=A0A834CHM7_ORYME|nr:hypothetical protein FQA47_013945 [Oryzias melastigma]
MHRTCSEELTLWLYENQTFKDNSQCAFFRSLTGLLVHFFCQWRISHPDHWRAVLSHDKCSPAGVEERPDLIFFFFFLVKLCNVLILPECQPSAFPSHNTARGN